MNEVLEIVKANKRVFIKPYGKGKGTGVQRLGWEKGSWIIDDLLVHEADIRRLLEETDEWIICQNVEQGEFSRGLYDRTANTIRMITVRDIHTQQFRIMFAVQRIGTSETIPVDNGSRGGLVCNIDLETGMLSEARSLHSLEVHECHPDSGTQLKGAVIPEWNRIKQQILKVAAKFPYMYFIAWDLVLTDSGICIIEANASSGVNIIQLWGGQRHGELGDFYRYHGVNV